MKKVFIAIFIIFFYINSTSTFSKSISDIVEIKLLDNLDDERGFCIDIRGHKYKAKIKKGLQAHTCYSYQGMISVDQGLDFEEFKFKKLFFPHFDVCVNSTNVKSSSILSLIKCHNAQEFEFNLDNTIRLRKNSSLCLTVANEDSKNGGGGSPVHLIRNLSLEACSEENSIYQTWGVRRFMNGSIFLEKISNYFEDVN